MAGEAEPKEEELFAGVRFVLFGFDSVSEAQYRSELVRRGGVDVGRYDSACTHVIVFGRVHEDPICVAARNDGKILVTELWIEDSVDFSELANSDRILYKPVRDLNGIPGSQSLIICLTGYQRRERDDIMKMVDLMGANFSKPLIASKVTHLVCYKFEGEKYELAKRVNIKLVNHQWLEDCLRAWEILPEDNYRMSGWDLEIMKAEAKNSDDDVEDYSRLRPSRKRSITSENTDMLQCSRSSSTIPTKPVIKQEHSTPHEILPSKSLPSPSTENNLSTEASHSLTTDKIAEEFNQDGDNELSVNADELKSVSPNCYPTGNPRNSLPSKDGRQKSALKGQRSSTLSANGQSPRLWNALPLKRKVPGLKCYSAVSASSPKKAERSPDSRDLSGKNSLMSPIHSSSRGLSSPVSPSTLLQPSESSKGTGASSSGMKNTVEDLGALSIDNPTVEPERSDKDDVLMSDLPDKDSGMEKSADDNSNPSRRVLSKALIKRVVAKRKMSNANKPISEQSNELERGTEQEKKPREESNEMVGVISKERRNSSSKGSNVKFSPQSVNQMSLDEPDFRSTEVEEPLVNEKNQKVNSLQVNPASRRKLRSAHSSEDAEKENKSTGTTPTKDKSVEKSSQRQIIPEPSWFIFSGHRLQRKEFQKIVKRLRGRICRDSHNWSYQATHYIAPDPLRRTEKFFAAAASGRWILKSDYLGACNEAGKFLPEEGYEWAGGALTEDGAISLEAPRKWRLLRERTGHGVFHGTRVVIYGECIAPSLDTLKRVVRAGEGQVMATSPPYTRAMKEGVAFAVVSAGTPRSDPWVEQFLSREIPCVLADYLVELVCKPGYSLDRHVLYGSHSSAEKSLSDLIRRHQ